MASCSDSKSSRAVATATPEPPRHRFASHQELRIGEIVLATAALEPEAREGFLRQLTVAEPALLEEARRRLRLATRLPPAFLAVPAAEILDAANQATKASADLVSTQPLAVGAERYELAECLGRGGMSRVYKAFDRHLQRPVALKLLERADPKTLHRLLREAQAQARVRHEYVLEVYETGDLEGQPFIAMHYVDGPTLMEIREEISLEQKVRLMAQVAEGLHAAHCEGLIHRDVKPSNVLVERTPSGKIKPWVADFGIATALDSGSSIWTAALAGTPYYIAPERLSDTHEIDRRSDIYSLGVTFYQLLSGELPFDHPSLAEMLRQVKEDEPPPLRARAPTLPAEIEAVVMKCLAKDPDQRYPTARAVADDLWRFLDGEAVEAHPTPAISRVAKTAGHRRAWLTGTLVAAVMLMALLTALALWTSARSKRFADQVVVTLDKLATQLTDEGRYQDDPLGRAHVESLLGACLTGLGRYVEAEVLLLSSWQIVRDQTDDSADRRETLDRLITLYDAWGRDDDVEAYDALRRPPRPVRGGE